LNSAKKETKKLVESMSPSICSSSVQGLHLSQPGEKKRTFAGTASGSLVKIMIQGSSGRSLQMGWAELTLPAQAVNNKDVSKCDLWGLS
jgi:hypothetical protein